METSIVFKDTKRPKLTITKQQIRIKLPAAQSSEESQRQITLFTKIVEEIGPVDFSLRGAIKANKVQMLRDNKDIYKTFDLNQLV